jgi:hypothetical protein
MSERTYCIRVTIGCSSHSLSLIEVLSDGGVVDALWGQGSVLSITALPSIKNQRRNPPSVTDDHIRRSWMMLPHLGHFRLSMWGRMPHGLRISGPTLMRPRTPHCSIAHWKLQRFSVSFSNLFPVKICSTFWSRPAIIMMSVLLRSGTEPHSHWHHPWPSLVTSPIFLHPSPSDRFNDGWTLNQDGIRECRGCPDFSLATCDAVSSHLTWIVKVPRT